MQQATERGLKPARTKDMNEPNTLPIYPSAPLGIGCDDFLSRAMNPQEGDWLECGDVRIDVKAVGDGKVWHDITTPKAIYNREMNLDDWPRTIKNALEKGAKFHARLNNRLT